MEYNVSISGSVLAFSAGACLGLGNTLLSVYKTTQQKGTMSGELVKQLSVLSFLGGGLTVFGVYTLVPNKIRLWWT
jgi:hypothetical protein